MCVLLVSCASNVNLKTQIDDIFKIESQNIRIRRNNYSDYVDYYVPSDLAEYYSSKLANIFTYNDSKLIMDINVPGILNAEHYPNNTLNDEGFFDSSKMVYHRESSYLDLDGTINSYFFNIYEYKSQYLLYFVSKDLLFYGYCNETDLAQMCSRMLYIAKSSSVKNDDVIANFSTKEVIDYQKKQVNLFETIMPVNGNIRDFLVNDYNFEADE